MSVLNPFAPPPAPGVTGPECVRSALTRFADEFPVTVVHSVDEALGAFGIV